MSDDGWEKLSSYDTMQTLNTSASDLVCESIATDVHFILARLLDGLQFRQLLNHRLNMRRRREQLRIEHCVTDHDRVGGAAGTYPHYAVYANRYLEREMTVSCC